MTDAERAYAAAEREIEAARRDGRDSLVFDTEAFRALERIPQTIGTLQDLRSLDLGQTRVADLAPLAELT